VRVRQPAVGKDKDSSPGARMCVSVHVSVFPYIHVCTYMCVCVGACVCVRSHGCMLACLPVRSGLGDQGAMRSRRDLCGC